MSTSVETLGDHHFRVVVFAPNIKNPVAHVRCAINERTRCAAYGEMIIDDDSGTPRQVLRAMVLMVRHALDYAQQRNITHATADVPPKMIDFTRKLSGLDGDAAGDGRRFAGDLASMRSRTLDTSDANGNLRD